MLLAYRPQMLLCTGCFGTVGMDIAPTLREHLAQILNGRIIMCIMRWMAIFAHLFREF